jgi:hypothetical protein
MNRIQPLATVWYALPAHSQRWILWQFVVGAFIVNAILSALVAWLFTLQQDAVSFSGVPLIDHTTVLVDSLGTLFVLPFLTTLIVTTIVRGELHHGELQRPAVRAAFDGLPHGRLRRGAVIGAACFAVFALPVALVLLLADTPSMSIGEFVAYKAVFGAVYGLPVTPVIALLALD